LLAVRDLLERTLEPDERALLILRYLHGFDAVEFAAMTGRTPRLCVSGSPERGPRVTRAAGRQPTTTWD